MSEALVAQVEAWIADDPDPADRDELTELLDQLPDDDSGEALRELAERFAGPLTFGTAGLRGPLRAGPNGMNRAVVSRAAAGLAAYLDAAGFTGPVVIGYDARYRSADFARDTAEIVRGAGREALLLPRQLPTPVLAFAVHRLDAAAGVMVTASHNPPQDNGYKVYLGGPTGLSAQIVPPADAEIQAAIAAVRSVLDLPRDTGYRVLGDDLLDSYLDAVAATVDPASSRELVSVATAMHGVGGEILRLAFERAGFAAPAPVPEQDLPDPDFPTVSFPNPEEPGAMDLLLALATKAGADVAIANDPDADRCAIAVPTPEGWRPLRGDEVGVLLADHLLRRGTTGTYATTIVSSSMLRALAERHEQPYAETLTGFKWIVRGALRTGVPLAYGYEEALGYCVAPDVVNDKDGISAALLVAELTAGLRADGRTIGDRLDDLAREYGLYATDQLSFRVDDLDLITAAMRRLRADLPTELLGQPLAAVDDLLPDADVLVLRGDGLRVVVRPSGTEPKLKCYLEVVVPTRDGNVTNARILAGVRLRTLREEMARLLSI